jgi:hypothetical protein
MSSQIIPCLLDQFEPPECRTTQPSLTSPGQLVRLLKPIIRIPVRGMNGFRNYFPMGHRVTSQLIRHALPRFAAHGDTTFSE